MAKIRMNDEYRKKILNRYIEHAEQEDTQEKQAYLDVKADIHDLYADTFALAKEVVSRAYPQEDVDTCRTLKKKYGSPLDVVAKDKCFYFSYANDVDEKDEDNYNNDYSEHFDFGLYGSCTNANYDSYDSGKKFAYALYRDELKAKDCNPDIYPQQEGNQDNPHKTQHCEANDKALGYSNYNRYNSDRDNNIGITDSFDKQWYLDIIGTSHCRSRTIACSKAEFETFQMFKKKKAMLISAHANWVDTITAQKKAMASMLKGMKNKTMTREQKIAERMKYDEGNTLVAVANSIHSRH